MKRCSNSGTEKIVSEEIKLIIVSELRKYNFKGSLPHFRRIHENGKVDYLSFHFNKYGGSFVIEISVAYPYKGKDGNFYYWKEVTPEFVKKSDYGYTKERFRITPDNDDWFKYTENNYKEVIKSALKKVMVNMTYFDNK